MQSIGYSRHRNNVRILEHSMVCNNAMYPFQRNKLEKHLNQDTYFFFKKMHLKCPCKILLILFGRHCVQSELVWKYFCVEIKTNNIVYNAKSKPANGQHPSETENDIGLFILYKNISATYSFIREITILHAVYCKVCKEYTDCIDT